MVSIRPFFVLILDPLFVWVIINKRIGYLPNIIWKLPPADPALAWDVNVFIWYCILFSMGPTTLATSKMTSSLLLTNERWEVPTNWSYQYFQGPIFGVGWAPVGPTCSAGIKRMAPIWRSRTYRNTGGSPCSGSDW